MNGAVKRGWPWWVKLPLWLIGAFVLWLVVTLLIVGYTLMEDEGVRAGWTIKYRTWLYYTFEGDDPNADLLPPAATLESFELYPGYTANLYASEVDFPIGAPVAINFDHRGRLWVANSPTYPHLLPGELPTDSIVILEDSDRDGVADKHTVFAGDLSLPMGFALVKEGALIVQAPDVVLARDDDGDGVMDSKEVVLSGFGTADSHHVISALEWGPDGALYMQDGWFLRSQVETPYGPRRLHDGGVWRYEPDTRRLDIVVSYNFANPWGHVFDDWGQSILCDASGGENYYLGYLMAPNIYPEADKPESIDSALAFLNRGRPTAGCDIVSSANFAPEDQGRFMVNQSIGFHGVRWNHFSDDPEGAGFAMRETDGDLLQSDHSAFRPVAMEFGPDGALYILDFYSPVIGHMQFSVRDERRDKSHGRIWRVTRDDGPTDWQPDFAAAGVDELVEHLKSEWAPWRFHARRLLQQMDATVVLPAVDRWLADLDPSDQHYAHYRLEGLWVHSGQRSYPEALLKELLTDADFRARAAAARLYRFVPQKGLDEASLVRAMLEDEHPRVRLEGILNAGQMASAEGAGLALLAANKPMDYGMEYALKRVVKALAPYGEPVTPEGGGGEGFLLKALPTAELLAREPTDALFAELLNRTDLDREQVRQLAEARAVEVSKTPAMVAMKALVGGVAAGTDRALAAVVLAAPDEELGALSQALPESGGAALQTVRSGLALRSATDQSAYVDTLPLEDALSLAVLFEDASLQALIMPRAQQVANGEIDASVVAKRYAIALAPDAVSEEVAAQLASYERGAAHYPELCGSCHQLDGRGVEGAFPPLAASDWFLADVDRAVRVVLHGLKGEVVVNGERYSSMMAPLGAVADDRMTADVLNYALNSWGNDGGWVAPGRVQALREQHAGREQPFTVEELNGF